MHVFIVWSEIFEYYGCLDIVEILKYRLKWTTDFFFLFLIYAYNIIRKNIGFVLKVQLLLC